MPNIFIPEGYNRVMPYLILNDPEAFLKFTATVFDAKEKMKMLNDDGSVMHAEITIGESCIMMGGASDQYGVQNAGLYIHVADADASYNKALEAGATSVMPPADQPYGRSGGVKDPEGNTWWITSTKPD